MFFSISLENSFCAMFYIIYLKVFISSLPLFFFFLAGRYVLMASLYDRLGGHVMKWSNLKGQQWGGATLPLFHEGEFYNIEVKVGGNIVWGIVPRVLIYSIISSYTQHNQTIIFNSENFHFGYWVLGCVLDAENA